MPVVRGTLSGTAFAVATRPGESVLAALLRSGVPAAFSCRGGTCRTCMLRCTSGRVPARAQRGLDPALASKGCFLPCICVPEEDLVIAPASPVQPAEAAAHVHPAAGEAPSSDGTEPGPDPDLWRSLDNGRLARAVLDDFYARVYADPLLSPFFGRVTREHAAGKQYAFLRSRITGEQGYFGESPRAAHHWMVISEDLFEHRQQLMRSAQRAQGLSDEQIARWNAYEEAHRADIVKAAPIPKHAFGRELPLEGYEFEQLSVGAVCDGCGDAVPPGVVVQYHVRLGNIACPRCHGPGQGGGAHPA